MAERRPALGKGLSALIPDSPTPVAQRPGVVEVDLDKVFPNEKQPRLQIDEAKLEDRKSTRLNSSH